MFIEMSLESFLLRLYLLFEMLSPGLVWMIFGFFGVVMLKRVYFGLILGLVVPLRLAVLPFLAEVCYVFVTGVWQQGIYQVISGQPG